jgi:cell division protein FtsI (penicillin-binding protein 3)
MSGGIFHHISEGVMAKNLKLSVEDARDSLSVFEPEVKRGDQAAASYVMNALGVKGVKNNAEQPAYGDKQMPSVVGMGARDAVYCLESRGVKVHIHGTGHVKRQDIAPGTALSRGMVCNLELN